MLNVKCCMLNVEMLNVQETHMASSSTCNIPTFNKRQLPPRIRLCPTRSRSVTDQPALTIQAFQQHIRDRYFATDSARGTPATFMWYVEEVGELATALNTTGDKRDPANIQEEFADVFAWLCTLANINHVDLAAALQKKYLTGKGPAGHK